jgi:2-succinyl-5-enolpyruvyl-6-hydroxy-3-cyclohexene-1-carboxylate synthase
MARASDGLVALLCTSGTAGANFYPAVIEAQRSAVPLIVLTADRPPELRDVGAAQTIDQNRLYGAHVKWFVDVALPEATPDLLRYARMLACRAVATAGDMPAGAVHLNFPFREPLVPTPTEAPAGLSAADEMAWKGRPRGAPWVAVEPFWPVPHPALVIGITKALLRRRRPVIVCGPQFEADLAPLLAGLAKEIGAPLLADPLSQLRWGNHDRSVVIDRYDAALRHEPTAQRLAPDLVLRFGGLPTSKSLQQYLQRHAAARQVVILPHGWSDPSLLASNLVHADPTTLCRYLRKALAKQTKRPALSPEWLAEWRRVDTAAGDAIAAYGATLDEPFEGRALAEVAALVPAGGTLFVSSSMPVRDLDAFAPGDTRRLRVLANRGANGIDGIISTALGVAAARQDAEADPDATGPLVLVLGDIAFYHDMNGLLAGRLHELDATIVVINNDGGGIFSFLPQAEHPAHFETLFGTPHGLDFEPVARMYGAQYRRANTWESLRDAVSAGVGGRGLYIVELRTDRARNVVLHRDAWAAVAAALATEA